MLRWSAWLRYRAAMQTIHRPAAMDDEAERRTIGDLTGKRGPGEIPETEKWREACYQVGHDEERKDLQRSAID